MTSSEVVLLHSGPTVEPSAYPDELVGRIDRLVEVRQKRTGEDARTARGRIESLIWLLGVNSVERMVER